MPFFSMVGGGAALVGALAALVHCAVEDEDTTVTIIKDCDRTKLDPANAGQLTLKTFLDTADEVAARATALETKLKDVCNAMNTDLGLPNEPDARAACNRVGGVVEKALNQAPDAAPGAQRAIWVSLRWDNAGCDIDRAAEAACVQTCGAPACDVPAKCAKGKLVGTCAGTCAGACITTGENVPCVGDCRGICSPPPTGVFPCVGGGDCTGKCNAATWLGNCSTGCTVNFRGACKGTCNGTCNGTPVGPGIVDAGAEAGPQPPPTGSDGNCPNGATCVGQCSSGASGSCASACAGDFSGGECAACAGSCSSVGTGCLTTCTGTCRAIVDGGACTGNCAAGCDSQVNPSICTGDVACEANTECKNVCHMKGALAAKCAFKDVEVRVAGDPALYAVLDKHGPAFADVVAEATILNTAITRIAGRNADDYKAIGATGELVRACVPAGAAVVEKAAAPIALVSRAGNIFNGLKL